MSSWRFGRSLVLGGYLCLALVLPSCRTREQFLSQFEDGNLPVVVVSTHGELIEGGAKKDAWFEIFDPPFADLEALHQSESSLSERIGIDIRGFSSARFPKKQYGFEVRGANGAGKRVGMEDMPAHEDWVLSAPYSDKSLIRNHFVYDLTRAMGRYAPRTLLVELFINWYDEPSVPLDGYRGVYVLTEKVTRGVGRVRLEELKTDEHDSRDIAGGYLLEIAPRGRIRGEEPSFRTRSRMSVVVKYPSAPTKRQLEWISSYVNDCERRMQEGRYRDCINDESFIDYFLLNELVRNHDVFTASTFFSKTRFGVLKMGPVWDFDRSIGDVKYGDNWKTSGFLLTERGFGKILLQDENFVEVYVRRWFQFRQGVLSTDHLVGRLLDRADELGAAAERNFEKWPVLGKYVNANKKPHARTHEEEIEKMALWLTERAAWLDEHMNVEEILRAARH